MPRPLVIAARCFGPAWTGRGDRLAGGRRMRDGGPTHGCKKSTWAMPRARDSEAQIRGCVAGLDVAAIAALRVCNRTPSIFLADGPRGKKSGRKPPEDNFSLAIRPVIKQE